MYDNHKNFKKNGFAAPHSERYPPPPKLIIVISNKTYLACNFLCDFIHKRQDLRCSKNSGKIVTTAPVTNYARKIKINAIF